MEEFVAPGPSHKTPHEIIFFFSGERLAGGKGYGEKRLACAKILSLQELRLFRRAMAGCACSLLQARKIGGGVLLCRRVIFLR